MPDKKKILTLITIALNLASPIVHAFPLKAAKIKAPPFTRITAEGVTIRSDPQKGIYILDFPENFSFPFTIRASGPLGGIVERQITSPVELSLFNISTGIIKNKNPNPQLLDILPLLCPRLKSDNLQPPFTYNGSDDRFNHTPIFQLLDPDAGKGEQYKSYTEMDGKNVLLLKKVRITYDYEDSNIIDYEGPHPITGKPHIVHEGEGGFYANIHYAIVPYDRGIMKYDRQTLLHLVSGKLKEIEKENLRPGLRTHSFIPGPFLSKSGRFYDMCEWGDTAHQAPVQELGYDEMALWDWDYSVDDADHVLLIVWEGDEEAWLVQEKLIDPFYLTDDLIGVFEIKKKETQNPLTLTNEAGNFEITVQTGDLKEPVK